MYRNRYQQGGATDSRQQIFMALSQQGLLGEMSFEEFQQIPPQELRQMLQGIQQQMQGQGQGQEMQGQQMQGQGQEMVQAQYGLRSSNIPPYYNSRAMYQNSGNTTGSADYDIEEEEEDQTKTIRKAEKVVNKNNREEVDWNKGNKYGNLSTKLSGDLTNIGAGIAKEQFNTEGGRSAGNVGANAAAAFGQGASAGAAMGPVGAAVMGTGAAAGSLIGDLAVATPGDSTYTANQAGTLGTSLVPTTAAYGMRTPQQAEQSAIAAARNRANNPNYVGSNYSYNPYGSVTRAGYNTGGRLKFQNSNIYESGRNESGYRTTENKDPMQDPKKYGNENDIIRDPSDPGFQINDQIARGTGLIGDQLTNYTHDSNSGRPIFYKGYQRGENEHPGSIYDYLRRQPDSGYIDKTGQEHNTSIFNTPDPLGATKRYHGQIGKYNDAVVDAKDFQHYQNEFLLTETPQQREAKRIAEGEANKSVRGWKDKYINRGPVDEAHRKFQEKERRDHFRQQNQRKRQDRQAERQRYKRYKRNRYGQGGVSNNDYRMAYEMGGGYYGKKY
jgi:hypothetical protein